MIGSPKFRINRNGTWQALGNKDIATNNYIINDKIVPIPFFSKNTIPLKIEDLLNCILINADTISVYRIEIDITRIQEYASKLVYFLNEKARCKVQITLNKSAFSDIDFSDIESFDGDKDEIFKKFLKGYIDNKYSPLFEFVGSIRSGLKGKATVLTNNTSTITLEYMAGISVSKKNLILQNKD